MPNFDLPLAYGYFESPLGPLLVAGNEDGLRLICFPTERNAAISKEAWHRDDAFFPETFAQLEAYFSGALKDFDLPLHYTGTGFQNTVWAALVEIPYGQTISYGELAARIGRPKASRAVGAANGANPLPIVVPCHRVIGADKSLIGFGGGLEIKQFLLDHEGVRGTQRQLL
jgi:methylated-DNA-[protein]-cysteine S-methyltransferase